MKTSSETKSKLNCQNGILPNLHRPLVAQRIPEMQRLPLVDNLLLDRTKTLALWIDLVLAHVVSISTGHKHEQRPNTYNMRHRVHEHQHYFALVEHRT